MMEIFDTFESLPKSVPVVVAVGVFDGVHLGHQMIIRNAIDDARRLGIRSAVITFEPHPEEVLSPSPPPRLSGPELKLELLSRIGPDMVLRIPFDKKFASQSPDEFIDLLRSSFDLRGVVVGSNFHFGRGGKGTPGSLVEAGNRFGFEVDLVPLMQMDGETVSSTLIRGLIREGDVSGAKNRMGRLPMFTGQVVPGHHRGRELGFETANLASPEPGAVPGQGVYGALAWLADRPNDHYAAALSIGSQPTFSGKEIVTEVHLLDFSEDLYGQNMQVEVCCRVRDQVKFDSPKELSEQIAKDIEEIRTRVAACRQT